MDFAIYFWGPLKTSDFKVKFSVRNIHLVVFEMIARALGKTFLPQGAAHIHLANGKRTRWFVRKFVPANTKKPPQICEIIF